QLTNTTPAHESMAAQPAPWAATGRPARRRPTRRRRQRAVSRASRRAYVRPTHELSRPRRPTRSRSAPGPSNRPTATACTHRDTSRPAPTRRGCGPDSRRDRLERPTHSSGDHMNATAALLLASALLMVPAQASAHARLAHLRPRLVPPQRAIHRRAPPPNELA